MKETTHNRVIILLSILTLGLLVAYFIVSREFLLSDTLARAELKELGNYYGASGLYGHGIGFLAALLMIFLWFYILRKRWNRLRGLGRLSQWLKYHMWFGVTAPLLATFHSGFKFDGLIGVMYWAMIAVMLSGIVGRYLYGHIPRRRDGHELTEEQINTEKAAKLRDLKMEFGITSEDINAFLALTSSGAKKQGILSSLFQLLLFDFKKKSQVNHVLKGFEKKYGMAPNDLAYLRETLDKQLVIAQRMRALDSVSKVFHWWHVIHKPFAYAIFLVLILHIILTISFGFTWIF